VSDFARILAFPLKWRKCGAKRQMDYIIDLSVALSCSRLRGITAGEFQTAAPVLPATQGILWRITFAVEETECKLALIEHRRCECKLLFQSIGDARIFCSLWHDFDDSHHLAVELHCLLEIRSNRAISTSGEEMCSRMSNLLWNSPKVGGKDETQREPSVDNQRINSTRYPPIRNTPKAQISTL
jgi:hypothetical protein